MSTKHPKPFIEIESELNNDDTDTSSLELDGIVLGSFNSWNTVGCGCPIQSEIHDTIDRVSTILRDYRDGKLTYGNG